MTAGAFPSVVGSASALEQGLLSGGRAKYTGALLRGCTRGGKAGMSRLRYVDDGCTVQPCYHRLAAAAGRTPVRDQLRTAGIHYIPRYAHALVSILLLTVRGIDVAQPVCLARWNE